MIIDSENMSMPEMRKKLLEAKEILRFLSECENCYGRFSVDYVKASLYLMDAASLLDERIIESEDK